MWNHISCKDGVWNPMAEYAGGVAQQPHSHWTRSTLWQTKRNASSPAKHILMQSFHGDMKMKLKKIRKTNAFTGSQGALTTCNEVVMYHRGVNPWFEQQVATNWLSPTRQVLPSHRQWNFDLSQYVEKSIIILSPSLRSTPLPPLDWEKYSYFILSEVNTLS